MITQKSGGDVCLAATPAALLLASIHSQSLGGGLEISMASQGSFALRDSYSESQVMAIPSSSMSRRSRSLPATKIAV